MIDATTIRRGLREPSLLLVLLRKLFPWRALARDPECAHLIRSWSSGTRERRTLNDVFPGVEDIDVQLRTPYDRQVGIATDVGEITAIVAMMKVIRARRVLEIGTNDGFTALNLAANLVGPNAVLCTLDLPVDEQVRARIGQPSACDPQNTGTRFDDEPEAERIRQFYGDSTALDWLTLGGPFDLIFIDGCHRYDFVVSDTRNALAHLAPGGVVVWHDYGYIPDVSRAVDERPEAGRIFAIRGTRLAVYRKL